MAEWNYGGAYKRYPVKEGEPVIFSDGSTLMAHDIFDPLPEFMRMADVIFTDSPWNIGNARSFYTKAEKVMQIKSFDIFYLNLFDRIKEISPRSCYLEIGKEYLGEYMVEMKRIFPAVTVYNSTYYHRKDNLCYIVQGTRRRKNRHYDGMDEEDIINAVAESEDGPIGDLCMGRGLVALAAARHGKKFVGTELNPKRLAVCLERLDKEGYK